MVLLKKDFIMRYKNINQHLSHVFLHFFQTLDLLHFPFFNCFLQKLELFWSSQGSSIPHKLQVFLQFSLHDLDFRHFFALHFLLHFFVGQLSSQPASEVYYLLSVKEFQLVVRIERVCPHISWYSINSINCTGCLSTQLLTTRSYGRVIRVGTSAQNPSMYVCKRIFEPY